MENSYIGYDGQEKIPPIPTPINKMVAKAFIEQLKNGKTPWQIPWTITANIQSANPRSLCYNPYRGVNVPLLWMATANNNFASPDWDTRRNWGKKGEKINSGEKGTRIVYFDESEADGRESQSPIIRTKTRTVFNHYQTEGSVPRKLEPFSPCKVMLEQETKMDDFILNVPINYYCSDSGFGYNHANDLACLPWRYADKVFNPHVPMENYFINVFPVLVKWTGHPTRLNRPTAKKKDSSAEKLISEMGSAFIGAQFGIDTTYNYNEKSRLNLIKTVRENSDSLVFLANEAAKACEYLVTLQPM